jgi:hypothetical protein
LRRIQAVRVDSSNTLLDPGVGTGLNIPLVPGTYTFALRGDGFDNNGGSSPTSTLSFFTSCGNATDLVQGSSVTLGSSTITLTSFSASRDVVGDARDTAVEAAAAGRRVLRERLDAFRAALWPEGVNPNPGRPYARERHLATVEK